MTWFLCAAMLLIQGIQPALAGGQVSHIKVGKASVRPEDVRSIDGLMIALYQVLSGPAGQPREWARDRTLYLKDCRFIWWEADRGGKTRMVNVDHQGAVDLLNGEMIQKGYFVREVHRVSQVYGNLAQIFSTYEAMETPQGPVTGRGVNSLQLVNDGERWWVMALAFDEESPSHPIPKEFLP
jgi:hypothetical protein